MLCRYPLDGIGCESSRETYVVYLVCIRVSCISNIALVFLLYKESWLLLQLDGRMLEAIGLAAGKQKPCFRQFPTIRQQLENSLLLLLLLLLVQSLFPIRWK